MVWRIRDRGRRWRRAGSGSGPVARAVAWRAVGGGDSGDGSTDKAAVRVRRVAVARFDGDFRIGDQEGKPDPEGCPPGAEKLGLRPEECLVIEDTPAGVAAGTAAGMTVLAVGTRVARENLDAPWVRDLTESECEWESGWRWRPIGGSDTNIRNGLAL